MAEKIVQTAPDFAHFNDDILFGENWNNQDIDVKTRSMIRRPVGATSIDGVKRRTRAGMGRCQGGFCSPRVAEILSEELHIPMTEVTKCGGESRLLVGTILDAMKEAE